MRRSSALARARDSSQRPFSNENDNENPRTKKRKLAEKITPCVSAQDVKISGREALSAVNSQQELITAPFSTGELLPSLSCLGQVDWEGTRMASEEVEALLNMKMTGKAKFDLKGRNDQMMEYIKKLRSCIRQLLQVESAYILQKEQQQIELQEERKIWKETETKFKVKQDELEAGLLEVNQRCSVLEEISAKSEAARQEGLLRHEKDSEALRAAADERVHLLEETEKLRKEASSAIQQVETLQDINRRLQEYNTSLQQYNSKLQSDAAQAIEENSRTQKEKVAILETLGTVRGNNSALQTQLDTVKASLLAETTQRSFIKEELIRLRGELQRALEEKEKAQAELQALTTENARFRELTGKSAAEIEVITSQAAALEERYHTQTEQLRLVKQQLDLANKRLEVAEASLAWQRKEGHDSISKLEQLQKQLAEADQKLHEGELLRRKLHNTIQELKGNIRVFCRVRPLLPDEEDSGGDSAVVQYPNSGELVGHAIELFQPQGQKYTFTFDKVFGPEAAQEDVFIEISQLVQSALDGYKVCIFAYGQTGSGKTHTMLGHPDNLDQRGVIPRSVEQIFQSSQALQAQGWKFTMQASMLEIYNETIRDLLANSRRTSLDSQRSDGGTPAKQHVVKHEPNGNTFVTDLTIVEVSSWKEVSSLLRQRSMQNENNAKPICLDGHNHGMMGSSSSPTADGSSLDSSHSCLASLTKAAQGVSPVNSDQSSSLLKAHDYIGFSEVSSTSLTAQECVMDQGDEKPVLKKNLNLNLHETELRLGPPKPVKEEEDGFFFHSKQQFLTASIDNTGNKVLLRVQSENKLGNASFSEGIDQHDDTELGDSGLNLNIGLSSKSNRDASYSREEIGENKVLLKPLVDSQERFLQEVNVTDIKRQESMQNVIVQRQQLEGEDDKSSPDNTTMQQLQSINSSRQKQDSVLKEKEMPHELHNFGPRIISFTPVRGSSELAPANKFWQSQMMVAKLTDGARLSQNHALQSPRLSQPEQEMGFSRAMAGGKFVAATPKNAVTGAKRVFSEVVGDDAVVINGASKMPSSTVKTACDTESRAYNQHSKHHLSPSRFSWSSAAAQSPASWQIGVQDLERPAAFDPLPAPRQLLINGDIRDPSHQFGNKVLPKKPSLLHTAAPSESSHDVQDAKATLDDVETDTAPRAPVGWPPVQSFRKNSLPPPKPKMHVERRMETIAAAPFPSPKVYSQSDCLFVKVYMDGLSIGRKIDLKSYDSYEKLSLALEEMFRRFSGVQVGNKGLTLGDNEVTVKGRKINFFCGSEYVLTYEDKDGDLMLVGDVPWGMFMITVKRLRIMKGSEAIGLAPRSSDKVRCE